MYTEHVEIIIDNINMTSKTISVAKDTIIKKDGVEVGKQRHRCAFVPGDIEAVKTYIGATDSPEIDYLNAIWTEDVIADYQASLSNE